MRVCVRACVCEWHVCARMFARVRTCVCACVCARARACERTCVRPCVHACVRASERACRHPHCIVLLLHTDIRSWSVCFPDEMKKRREFYSRNPMPGRRSIVFMSFPIAGCSRVMDEWLNRRLKAA